jgi:hypothetical protein
MRRIIPSSLGSDSYLGRRYLGHARLRVILSLLGSDSLTRLATLRTLLGLSPAAFLFLNNGVGHPEAMIHP